ncbi:hypothetical protein [Spirosoma pollinicola]|uniref:Uncharacterized protein n=1 Tax=Spirosoma pollinicola TaxID=2057025 RepID=A0A2K8Z2D0_9BACT|nr:hypothetical protein [Spirosoma pollinicola]AUD04042.1 hypothetical protein CWM47_20740 [Spirosoma pollinicola]
MPENDPYRSRFNRWHDKQMDYLSFSINLVFTITIGVVSFVISQKDLWAKPHVIETSLLYRGTLVLLGLSATVGVGAVMARLLAFRYTKDKVKVRWNIKRNTSNLTQEKRLVYKNELTKLAKRILICEAYIWPLFYSQVGLLLLAIWSLIVFF